jgi:hypothetical protein
MAYSLRQPLTDDELHRAACELVKEKAPGPDSVPVNFITTFWPQVGTDCCQMVCNSVRKREFPNGITKDLNTLIPKSRDKKLLNNWRPITLLNVAYKI